MNKLCYFKCDINAEVIRFLIQLAKSRLITTYYLE